MISSSILAWPIPGMSREAAGTVTITYKEESVSVETHTKYFVVMKLTR